ncbi:hypothetical protein ASPACDRAFT_1853895 [Aspergillus aculeatus ATCC 16872]|uniref:Transcription factor domain-containing protein n=1 Tax=Aspergillus aculeatus (strain ATCC 16872 / CBS 172.66 / WB 5094) TaxID=690307 RepID=A0A1L9X0G9_ASPA1|nr:uncharacterized protein ASPACDRAFT_1853895 [Aspergillus aculeatus ATCC 16872]OJK01846.1 hypothetical protein ASPACDRAFT_1853895 [Aspergillus aculeatus ATCC 16872]
MNRLPGKATYGAQHAALLSSVAAQFPWTITSDEKRCLSFLWHHLIPASVVVSGVSDLFSPRNLIGQLSAVEPAVYHALVALSAINHRVLEAGIAIPGQSLCSKWHHFALEQSLRAFTLLKHRPASQDPRLRQVILVCCLLFVLMELASARYDDANTHLQAGLRILYEEAPFSFPIDPILSDAFLYLESHAAFHGVHQPFRELDAQFVRLETLEIQLRPCRSVEHARQALNPLVPTIFRLLERCWSLSETDLARQYGVLQPKQQRLLSCLTQVKTYFDDLLTTYPHFTDRERRSADVVQLSLLTFTLSLKTCLHAPWDPALHPLRPEFEDLMANTVALNAKLGTRPQFTPDGILCAALSFLALRCPDYRIRLQAIAELRASPRAEGYYNGLVVAEFAISGLKLELTQSTSGSIKQDTRQQRLQFKNTPYPQDRTMEELLGLQQDEHLLGSIATLQGASDWLSNQVGGQVQTECSEVGGHQVWYLNALNPGGVPREEGDRQRPSMYRIDYAT